MGTSQNCGFELRQSTPIFRERDPFRLVDFSGEGNTFSSLRSLVCPHRSFNFLMVQKATAPPFK